MSAKHVWNSPCLTNVPLTPKVDHSGVARAMTWRTKPAMRNTRIATGSTLLDAIPAATRELFGVKFAVAEMNKGNELYF